VVLIVLDTMRRDHMSLYGYARRTTPVLERWASRGMVFDDATSVATWTLPSHASMFTGLWPRSHGAHAVRSEREAERNGVAANVLPLAQEHATLAEIARDHGYRTAGFTANHYYLSKAWGMDQGFEDYLCRQPRPGLVLKAASDLASRWSKRRLVNEEMPCFNASELTRAALAWLQAHRKTPFFLFLNYMEAHSPNAAPGSQGLPFEDEAYVSAGRRWRPSEVPAEQRSFVNEYDREVIYLDRWLGVLLDYLERSGLGARTLVILTSDHGEFLGEHEFLGHGKDLYSETLSIPLIVWEPGAPSGRSTRSVQNVDLFPTILRYLALPIPGVTQGQPLLEVNHPIVSEEYYAPFTSEPLFDRVMRSIRAGEYSYLASSRGEERLFHVASDPHATRNLISERTDVARSARGSLEEWLRTVPEARSPRRSRAPRVRQRSRRCGRWGTFSDRRAQGTLARRWQLTRSPRAC